MFYAHFVLSKRGPLAKIWLAAHWEKKLTKAQVYETNIDSSVEAILQPKVKMALRTSGHLLLGVVRIYSRKAKYLLTDCNEAFVKIKMAFRPDAVDLPENNREAAIAAVTLPESFHDFDTNFADFEVDMNEVQAKFSVNQSRPEEITMKEDLGHVSFIPDDGFGDLGFDDREILRDASNIEDSLFRSSDVAQITVSVEPSKTSLATEKSMEVDLAQAPGDDGFGDEGLNNDFMEGHLFETAPHEVSAVPDITEELTHGHQEGTHADDIQPPEASVVSAVQPSTIDQTTLVTDEEEAFALEPLDVTSMPGTERRPKRKRKLIVDSDKSIPSDAMKSQLSDTVDIVTTLDLAPPTKRLLHWKETGGVNKLFTLPGRPLSSKALSKLFVRNIAIRASADDDEELASTVDHPAATASPGSPPEMARDASGVADTFEDAGDQSSPQDDEQDESIGQPAAAPLEATESEEPDVAPLKKRKKTSDRVPVNEQSAQSMEDGPMDVAADGDVELPAELSTLPISQDSVRENGDDGEDKRLNKRTLQMASTLAKSFDKHNTVSLKDMVKKHSHKQVAAKFYTVLVLCKQQLVTARQDSPYDDIILSKGEKFDRAF